MSDRPSCPKINEHQSHRRGCTELRELLQDGLEHLQPQHQPFHVQAAESGAPPTGQGLPWPALQGGAKQSAAGDGTAFPQEASAARSVGHGAQASRD